MNANKLWLLCFVGLLAACAPGTALPASAPPEAGLPNYGPAPELTNTVWLNTDQPLRLADLRGRVVLIDMWTFG